MRRGKGEMYLFLYFFVCVCGDGKRNHIWSDGMGADFGMPPSGNETFGSSCEQVEKSFQRCFILKDKEGGVVGGWCLWLWWCVWVWCVGGVVCVCVCVCVCLWLCVCVCACVCECVRACVRVCC